MNQQVFAYAGNLFTYPLGMYLRSVTVEEEKLIQRIGRLKSFVSNNHGSIVARVVTLPSDNGQKDLIMKFKVGDVVSHKENGYYSRGVVEGESEFGNLLSVKFPFLSVAIAVSEENFELDPDPSNNG